MDMHRFGLAGIIATALVALASPAALAADGDLDTVFAGGAGFRVDQFSLTPTFGSFDDGLTLGADGSPFVTQFAPAASGEEQFTTTKFVPDGSAFDTTFGTGGTRLDQTGFGAAPFSDAGVHLVVAPDGTIVVPGERGDDTGIFTEGDIQRYTATGGLDVPFGGGSVHGNLSFDASAHGSSFSDAVALVDGSVVVAGSDAQSASRDETLVAKYTPAGILDTSFAAPNGFLHQQLAAGTDDSFWERLLVAPDGKLLVLGQSSGATNGIVTLVQRLMPNGTPDPTFGTGGLAKIQLSALTPDAKTVNDGFALAPDGSIFVGGSVSDFMNGPDDDTFKVAVTKLQPNGTPDPAFGTGGSVLHQFGVAAGTAHPDSSLRDLALAPDGKIVVGGEAGDAAGKAETLVARFLPNGTLDPTFGTGGAFLHQFADPASFGSQAFSITVTPSGAIVLAGDAPDAANRARTLLARLVGNTAPVAKIAPITAKEAQSVTLDGSASTDSDGTIASYAWDVTGDGKFDLSGPKPSLTFVKGPQTVTLQVTDNYGVTATAKQTFNVEAEPGIVKAPGTGTITGTTASIVLVCAPGPRECRGAVALSSVSGKHAATARRSSKPRKAVGYGRSTFSMRSGQSRTVKIHLTLGARRAIGHHRSLRAYMLVTTKAGSRTRTVHRTVTLRVHHATHKSKHSHKKH